MGLLNFLTGAASLFGKPEDKQTKTQSQSTDTNTATTGQTDTTATSKNKTIQNTTNTQSGSSTTSQDTASKVTGSGSNQSLTSGTSTQFSSNIMAALEQLLTSQLGNGTTGQVNQALSDQLTKVQGGTNFDVGSYVNGVVGQAQDGIQANLDSTINSLLSSTGTSESGNSMSALLASQLRNSAAANLAGVKADATAKGTELQRAQQESRTGQISTLSSDLNSSLQNLLSIIKGGTATQIGQQVDNNQTTQNTTGSQDSTTNELSKSLTGVRGLDTTTEKQVRNETGLTTSTVDQKAFSDQRDSKNLFGRISDALSTSAKIA